jgi:FtsH-binding integral membrane protein
MMSAEALAAPSSAERRGTSRYARRVAEIHPWLGAAVIAVCAVAAFTGGYLYWRGRGAGRVTTHLLSLAQTLLVAQVGVGLLLLADDRRAAEQLHYAYGTMALGAALVPWFYAPAEGPRRLLWFAATTAVAAALAIRAYTTGSA